MRVASQSISLHVTFSSQYIFSPKNGVCLLHLLHIFKCFYHMMSLLGVK